MIDTKKFCNELLEMNFEDDSKRITNINPKEYATQKV